MRVRTLFRLISVMLALILAGPSLAQPAPVAPQVQGYVLGVGDVVEVSVLGRDEFHPRVQVQTDGTIQLPFLNSIPASNLTALQLRDDVTRRLKTGAFYADPIVNVSIVTFSSRYVTVLGEVASPGLIPIDRAYRLSEILAKVGGAKSTGAHQLSLRRATGEELKLDVTAISSGGPDQDPVVNPGDKIFVPVAATFYIYGQVRAPGTFQIDADMTLRKAIARGGGLSDRGSEKRVQVIREGKELKHFDLSGPIEGGDVIVVGERLF